MARAERESALAKLRFAAESWEDRARNAGARLEEAGGAAPPGRARVRGGAPPPPPFPPVLTGHASSLPPY